jgi:hypothetical protein
MMSKELTVRNDSIDDDIRLANALAQSGFYKDIRDAAAGVVKLRIARELGLGLRGISDVHIVEGKPTLSYQAILGMVRNYTGPHGTDRYSFKYLQRDEDRVEIEWTINGEIIGTSKCDTEDAKRMGLGGRGTWQKYPRQMRTARAVTEGVNAFMPEVIGGSIYTPEELGDESGINGREGGSSPSQVASSDAALPPSPPPTLTLKPAESQDEVAEAMIVEAITTMDAAEETLDGEVIDPTPDWVEAAKKFFAALSKDEKVEAGKLLKIHGYLPDGKLTQAEVYESLADTLGIRCLELDIVMKELAA